MYYIYKYKKNQETYGFYEILPFASRFFLEYFREAILVCLAFLKGQSPTVESKILKSWLCNRHLS